MVGADLFLFIFIPAEFNSVGNHDYIMMLSIALIIILVLWNNYVSGNINAKNSAVTFSLFSFSLKDQTKSFENSPDIQRSLNSKGGDPIIVPTTPFSSNGNSNDNNQVHHFLNFYGFYKYILVSLASVVAYIILGISIFYCIVPKVKREANVFVVSAGMGK